MNAPEIDLREPISPHIGRLVLRVRFTGLKLARARLWIALPLLRLAAAIAGPRLEIELRKP